MARCFRSYTAASAPSSWLALVGLCLVKSLLSLSWRWFLLRGLRRSKRANVELLYLKLASGLPGFCSLERLSQGPQRCNIPRSRVGPISSPDRMAERVRSYIWLGTSCHQRGDHIPALSSECIASLCRRRHFCHLSYIYSVRGLSLVNRPWECFARYRDRRSIHADAPEVGCVMAVDPRALFGGLDRFCLTKLPTLWPFSDIQHCPRSCRHTGDLEFMSTWPNVHYRGFSNCNRPAS